MTKVIKLLYALSIPVFLINLLYVYAFLPDYVGIYFDQGGEAEMTVSKTDFFYSALGLFILTNGLILLFRRMKRGQLNLSKTEFSDMTGTEVFYHWLNGLSFVINVIYTFSIMFIGMFHSSEHFDITDYVALIYIGPVLLVGWVFWFIYLQFSKR